MLKKNKEEKKELEKITKDVKKSKTTSSKSSKTKSEIVSPKKSTKSKSELLKNESKNVKTSKKAETPKKVSKKNTSKSKTTSNLSSSKKTKLKPSIEVLEYYDLPYRYNQTVVKVLYQTPNVLFIYWDLSDDDRQKLINKFGDNFFNDTKPVLIVHNDTLHYSFEIEIDDFANSWYLHVNDSNCKYAVELGRRPKYYNNEKTIDIPNDYVYVTYSNEIESPNDHVLFDKNLTTVYFKDIKTNIVTAESITTLSFIRNMGRIYDLYDLKTNFIKDTLLNEGNWFLDLNNPTSANPSSKFK